MTGRSTESSRQSDLGTVEAQDTRRTPERAPERLTEERPASPPDAISQVGPGGWLPRAKQPRDARTAARVLTFPARWTGSEPSATTDGTASAPLVPRKEGGTAGVNASRPFGQSVSAENGGKTNGPQRSTDACDRRDTPMSAATTNSTYHAFPNHAHTVAHPAATDAFVPTLHAVTPAQPMNGALTSATDRIVSLGGFTVPTLSTFTISSRLRGRDLLSETDFTPDEMAELLDTAGRLKDMLKRGQPHHYLTGKTLGMIFEHPSTRTRVSLQAGMAQLGGQAIVLNTSDLQLARGETIGDTAQILSRYVNGIAARVASHDTLVELAKGANIPVYNALSDKYHPMQALTDMFTLHERFGSLAGLKLVFVGDGTNNMAASLLLAGAALGVHVTIAAPKGYQPDPEVVTQAKWLAGQAGHDAGSTIQVTDDPFAAAKDADAIYTDVHVSLGMADGATRAVALAPYKVTRELMAAAKPSAIFLHCLPMHRGEEVDADVAEGPQSVIFDQAENRLHVQKALLLHTLC